MKEQLEKYEENIDDLRSYVLMERIYPAHFPSRIIRNGEFLSMTCMSEGGWFSNLLVKNDRADRSKQKVLVNETFGTLVRTKGNHENEGGVCAGFAVIDDFCVVDDLIAHPESSNDPMTAEFLPMYSE